MRSLGIRTIWLVLLVYLGVVVVGVVASSSSSSSSSSIDVRVATTATVKSSSLSPTTANSLCKVSLPFRLASSLSLCRGGHLGLPEEEDDDDEEDEDEDEKGSQTEKDNDNSNVDGSVLDVTANTTALVNKDENVTVVKDEGDNKVGNEGDDVYEEFENEKDDGDMDEYDSDYDNEEYDNEDDEDEFLPKPPETQQKVPTKSSSSSSSSTIFKGARQLWKQHKRQLFIALLVYTFRHELRALVQRIWKSGSGNGILSGQKGPFGKSNLLIVAVVVLFLLQQQQQQTQGQQGQDTPMSPIWGILVSKALGVSPIFIVLARLLWMDITPSNTAYIPPVQQHYSFEVLNHRHVKDAMALEKVTPLSSSSSSSSSPFPFSGWNNLTAPLLNIPFSKTKATPTTEAKTVCRDASLSRPSTVAALYKQDLKDGIATCATTGSGKVVIVLEMTTLDARLSQLDAIRDKITFLLSHHRRRALSTATEKNNTSNSNNNQNNKSHASANADENSKQNEKEEETLHSEDSPTDDSDSGLSLEVVVVLESAGGSAAEYALAAQQLLRLRNEPGITLTVIVDKVAASGT